MFSDIGKTVFRGEEETDHGVSLVFALVSGLSPQKAYQNSPRKASMSEVIPRTTGKGPSLVLKLSQALRIAQTRWKGSRR
jgi:hypothetical protein